MPAYRYYIDAPLEGRVTLTGEEANHLRRVFRQREGEMAELVNGRGDLAQAEILSIDGDVQLEVKQLERAPLPRQLHLRQGLPRPNRLGDIVEKGTELGATRFQLFPAERSERKEIGKGQLERLSRIAIAAMKQCGALYLPQIELIEPIERWQKPDIPSFFGDLSPAAPFLEPVGDATIVIGPESGLSEREEAMLRELGLQGRKLHHNVLRTDTAAFAALTLLSGPHK
jgi:16S rRNA (uracil1498-N3)-methyltransferase